jgi:toxin HigB-1
MSKVASSIRRYRARFCTRDLLRDLSIFPGNHLEGLKGNRKGQHSIRINDQYRICFVWRDGDAFDVEIVDYH